MQITYRQKRNLWSSPLYWFSITATSFSLIIFGSGGISLSRQMRSDQSEKALYEVVTIFSVDTLRVKRGDQVEIVRLIGVNAPVSKGITGGDCYAPEANSALVHLLNGHKVSLEIDPTQIDRDGNNRLWRYVYREDGVLINELLVQEGYAREYLYGTIPYSLRDDFVSDEQFAREQQKGVWSCDH